MGRGGWEGRGAELDSRTREMMKQGVHKLCILLVRRR